MRNGLKSEVAALADRIPIEGLHARTPRIVADLAAGLHYFFTFAVEVGAIDLTERNTLFNRCWEALLAAGAEQAAHTDSADPCRQFLRLLAAAVASDSAHVAAPGGDSPDNAIAWGWRNVEYQTRDGTESRLQAAGRRIGWLDGSDLLLEPEASYAEAQRLAGEQGESLPVSCRTLRKRLKERGLLASTGRDAGREALTVRRVLEGTRREVLHLLEASLSPVQPDQSDHQSEYTGINGQITGQVASREIQNPPTNLPTKPEGNDEMASMGRSETAIEGTSAGNPEQRKRRSGVL